MRPPRYLRPPRHLAARPDMRLRRFQRERERRRGNAALRARRVLRIAGAVSGSGARCRGEGSTRARRRVSSCWRPRRHRDMRSAMPIRRHRRIHVQRGAPRSQQRTMHRAICAARRERVRARAEPERQAHVGVCAWGVMPPRILRRLERPDQAEYVAGAKRRGQFRGRQWLCVPCRQLRVHALDMQCRAFAERHRGFDVDACEDARATLGAASAEEAQACS